MDTLVPEEKFMREAIRQAEIARDEGDYAVGAVLVRSGQIVVVASNRSRRDESPIAHAEALAIIEGSKLLKSRHIPDGILYTTHEPCPMCASLVVWGKLRGLVYGARIQDMAEYRNHNGNSSYLWRTIHIPCEEIIGKSIEEVEIVGDFLREECVKLFHS